MAVTQKHGEAIQQSNGKQSMVDSAGRNDTLLITSRSIGHSEDFDDSADSMQELQELAAKLEDEYGDVREAAMNALATFGPEVTR